MGMADVRMSNVTCLRTYKAGQFSVVFFKPIVSIVYCYVHIFAHVILGKGLKVCSSRLRDDVSHHFVSRRTIADTNRNHAARLTSESTAEKELFLKTLGFFCALKETGCLFTEDTDREEENHIAYDPVGVGLTSDQYMESIDTVLDNGALHSSRR